MPQVGKQAPSEIGQNWGTIISRGIVQGPPTHGTRAWKWTCMYVSRLYLVWSLVLQRNEAPEAEGVAPVTLEVNGSQVLGARDYTPILL